MARTTNNAEPDKDVGLIATGGDSSDANKLWIKHGSKITASTLLGRKAYIGQRTSHGSSRYCKITTSSSKPFRQHRALGKLSSPRTSRPRRTAHRRNFSTKTEYERIGRGNKGWAHSKVRTTAEGKHRFRARDRTNQVFESHQTWKRASCCTWTDHTQKWDIISGGGHWLQNENTTGTGNEEGGSDKEGGASCSVAEDWHSEGLACTCDSCLANHWESISSRTRCLWASTASGI